MLTILRLFPIGMLLAAGAAVAQQVEAEADTQPTALQSVEIVASTRINRLHLRAMMKFPSRIKNVRDSTEYLLEPVEYKIVSTPENAEALRRILARPLPTNANDGRILTIEEAMLELSGDDTVLIVDHKNHLITFELLPQKRK